MELFRLFGSVMIDNKDAIKNLKEADAQARNSKKVFKNMGDNLKKFGKWAAVGTAGAVTALTGLAAKSADTADEIHKGSQRMGISTDAYQEMEYWASQNGLAQEQLEKGVGRLNQRMGEAADGNEKYSGALEKLGVNMDGVREGTISTEDAFAQSIQSLSEMENGQEQAALASELFGTKLGRDLLPTLQDGALGMDEAKQKAKEMGIVIGEDAVLDGVKFKDTWDTMKRTLGGFASKVGLAVLPILQSFLDWITVNMPLIKEKIKLAMDTGKEVVDNLKNAFQFLKENANLLIPVLAGLLAGLVAYKIVSTITSMITFMKGAMIAWKATTFAQTLAQNGLNAALLANPIGIVIAAIAAIIAIGVALYMNWDTVKAKAQQLWNKIKAMGSGISTTFGNMKRLVVGYISGLVSSAKSKFSSMKNSITTTFSNVYSAIMDPINRAKEAVSTAVEKMKGFFDFNWSIPKIKMPKFSVSGSKNPLKWLEEGVPKLSVNWNAKGGIFDKPTIFNTGGGLQGVGEAGPEAILPLNDKTYAGMGKGIADALSKMVGPQREQTDNSNRPIVLQIDGRTFAQVIGDYTGAEGGLRIRRIERGLPQT